MNIKGTTQQKIKEFVTEIIRIQNTKKSPLSARETITLYNDKILNKYHKEKNDFLNIIKELEIEPEVLLEIEKVLEEDNVNYWTVSSLFDLLNLSKTRIKISTIIKLENTYLKNDNIYKICSLCSYFSNLNIKDQCSFFKVVLEKYWNKSYLVGDISVCAADLSCTNCLSVIKNISESIEVDNPRAKYFALEALKKLSIKDENEK